MSAFFVGPDHVNAILSAIHRDQNASVPLPGDHYARSNDIDALTALGKILLSENIKSLQHRYPSDWQEMVDCDVNTYKFSFDSHFAFRKDFAIAAIKLCQSLDYQSCEHDEWEESAAKHALERIKDSFAMKMPGYEAAPWHYDTPADAPTLIRIM